MGEDDPLLSRLLDRLDRPRYLSLGSREGLRRLREGIPDFAVTAGPTPYDVESVDSGGWTREWGLLVQEGNPEGVSGLADLVDRDLRFVNRDRQSGLRASLEAGLEELADERERSRSDLTDAINGFEMTASAYESPPRRVLSDKADAALGLRATATKLGLDFVGVDRQEVRIHIAPDRTEKPALGDLERLVPPEDLLGEFEGYGPLTDST